MNHVISHYVRIRFISLCCICSNHHTELAKLFDRIHKIKVSFYQEHQYIAGDRLFFLSFKTMSEGDWHKHQKSYFAIKEKKIGSHTADAIYNNLVFEFQDKHIQSIENINDKNKDYQDNGFMPVWILRMSLRMCQLDSKCIALNKFIDSFWDSPHVFLWYKGYIVYVPLKRGVYIYDSYCSMKEEDFYSYIIQHSSLPTIDMFSTTPIPIEKDAPKIRYIQKGAGNGKTYGMCFEIMKSEESNHIVLTKVNSAKKVVFDKFEEIIKKYFPALLDAYNDQKSYQNSTYYKLTFETKNIVIGTIDSLLYNFIGKEKFKELVTCDVFANAASVAAEKPDPNLIYREIDVSNSTLYVDEAQDLHPNYYKFIKSLSSYYGTKIELVGDILQTIYVDKISALLLAHRDPEAVMEPLEQNIIRRFKNPSICEYLIKHLYNDPAFELMCRREGIEALIQLPQVGENITTCNDSVVEETLEECVIDRVKIDKESGERIVCHDIIEDNFQKNVKTILSLLDTIQDLNLDMENELVFLFPVINTNPFAELLCESLNEYFQERFKSDKIYCHLFKREDKGTIRFEDAEGQAHMCSIHSAKGGGWNNVFVMDLADGTIFRHPKAHNERSLFYFAMKNVALTRAKRRMFVLSINKPISTIQFKCQISIDEVVENLQCLDSLLPIYSRCSEYQKYLEMMEEQKPPAYRLDYNFHRMRYRFAVGLKISWAILESRGRFETELDMKIREAFKLKSKPIYVKCETINQYMREERKYNKRETYTVPLMYYKHYNDEWNVVTNIIDYAFGKGVEGVKGYLKKRLDKCNTDFAIKEPIMIMVVVYIIMKHTMGYRHQFDLTDWKSLLEVIRYMREKEYEKDENFKKDIERYFKSLCHITKSDIDEIIENSQSIGNSKRPKVNLWDMDQNMKIDVYTEFLLYGKDKLSKGNIIGPKIICYPINAGFSFLNFHLTLAKAVISAYILKEYTGADFIIGIDTLEDGDAEYLRLQFEMTEEDKRIIKQQIRIAAYGVAMGNAKKAEEILKRKGFSYSDVINEDNKDEDLRRVRMYFRPLIAYNMKEVNQCGLCRCIRRILKEQWEL